MHNLSVILLHAGMSDKQGHAITSSLTLIDVHDIARSCRTYGVNNFFVFYPAPTLRKLARTLQSHWEDGFGATYNPNRKDALSILRIVSDLDEAIQVLELHYGKLPKLIATSARSGIGRIGFAEFSSEYLTLETPYLLMLGTGWGMSDELLGRADYFLEPITGAGDYNHLSVR